MVIIAFRLKDNEVSNQWLKDTHTRLITPTNHNMFCKGIVKSFDGLHIVHLQILFFKIWYLGLIFMIGSLVWNKGTIGWSIIPGLILTLPIVLWLSDFNFLLLKAGLKKAGYKGKVKRVSLDEAMYRVLKNE